MPTGAELFVDSIERHGIRDIFTLVGDHLNDVLLCAGKRGLRILDMRHEAAVVHAADAWARIHRRPALALVTGGPGHTNAITGIATAYLACSPVIAVSGSRPAGQAQRGAFQDVDQIDMVKRVVKWCAEPPSAAQIPHYVDRAVAEATAGRMGPVHLTVPVDVFAGQANATAAHRIHVSSPHGPDPRGTKAAADLIEKAERPLIIAGAGVWWSRAEAELAEFAEKRQIPVYTVSHGRGVLPDSHPLAMGYADPSLNRGFVHAAAEADLIIVLGKRIDFRLALGSTRLFPETAKFIQVDIHPQELGLNRRLEAGICADARLTLQALSASLPQAKPNESWLGRVRELRDNWRGWIARAAQEPSSRLTPAAFFAELANCLPPRLLYSWDGGDFSHWGRVTLPALEPGGWLRLGPLATIGAALPNGLALQMAHPDRPVAVITGDGSLGFYIAELDTAVRHNLPIVVIVGNDAGWGLERELQGAGSTVACELRATRYDVVMQGFGGEGENITSAEQIAPAVQRAFAARRPYLLNVNVVGVRSPFTRWKMGDPD